MRLSQRRLVGILLFLLVVLGYSWYRLQNRPAPLTTEERTEAIERGGLGYTNFLTDYSVIVPEAWLIEDVSQPLATFFGPTSQLEGGDEQSLYEQGAVSLQVVGATLETPEAFLAYVRGPIESGLRERSVEFTGKEEKIEGYDGYRVSITNPYPLTQLIVNGPLVTRVSFQKKPTKLGSLLASLEQTTELSGDAETVVGLTNNFFRAAKDGKETELYASTSVSFRSNIAAEQFKQQLDATKDRFALRGVLVSLLETDDAITTRSALVDQENNTMNRVTLIFKREDGAFKLDGASISQNQPSTFPSLEPQPE